MANPVQEVIVCRMGQMAYEPAWSLQRRLQHRLVSAKRAEPAESIPHIFLIVEHPAVYTLGKSGDVSNLLADEAKLESIGASFVLIDRGGDITYHGPGQLVGYPILDLDRFYTDIHRYLRELEEIIIRTCADFGVIADRIEGRTGVWIAADERGIERKICAMGIHCSRWVTMHGFAFNLNTSLDHFSLIVPCGINDGDVTSLSRELDMDIDELEVQDKLLGHFGDLFFAELTILERSEAEAFLKTYLPESAVTG